MNGFRDLRFAMRRLGRTPGFTLVAVLVLGLGIGANTSLFSALNAVLLAQPPYPDAERMVVVDLLLSARADMARDTFPWSYPKFDMTRNAIDGVDVLAAYAARTGTLTGDGVAARIGVEYVTPSYFQVLGTRPVAGRVFGKGEEYPAPGDVAFVSHGFWLTRFGGDGSLIGRTVTVDGIALEVVGVGPPGFRGLSGAADLFVPIAGRATMRGARQVTNPWSHWLRGIGHLRAGVALEEAQAEAAALGEALTEAYPDPSGGGSHGVAVVPFLSARINPVARLAVIAVSVGAFLLLLIASSNVAGLLLARAAGRRTDTAVRAALGAGRGRLAREYLFEGLILAMAGGALGLLFAVAGTRVVSRAVRYALDLSGTRGLQFLEPESFAVNEAVLLAGIVLALLTGLVFGLVPARTSSRPDLTLDLRAGGRSVGRGLRDGLHTGGGVLVAGQLALTLILLAGAGLMSASFLRLTAIDPGFGNDDVLTVRFERSPAPSPEEEDRIFEARLLERMAALPGVRTAAVAPCPPLTQHCEVLGISRMDDGPVIDFGNMEAILGYAVSDDYFATIGAAVREGRAFQVSDLAGNAPVAVINQAAAARFFAGESALGHRIAVTHRLTEERMAEIVGVVDDVRYAALEESAIPAIYFSRRQASDSYGTLFLHTSVDPLSIVSEVRRTAAEMDADMPLYDVTTLAALRAGALARTRIVLGLFAAFASTGLVLSALGLYAVVSYAVVHRTREMGLRVALGAVGRDLIRVVVAPPIVLTAAGAALGIGGAVFLTRFVSALLYGIEPTDVRVLLGAVLLLIVVAVGAALIPARRVMRVDPAIALRGD